MDTRKAVFTAIGTVEITGQKKKMRLNSPQHWQAMIQKLTPQKRYGISVEEYKAARSRSQLNYYWVLLGYLGDHTGYVPEELHDALMRAKFGVKTVRIGPIEQTVRKSIANIARFPKSDMVELITQVLEICESLEIKVPTKEELGYL